MNTPKAHWELKLSSLHVVVLVGLITGSMVAAFYLGFLSGERTGFESGQEASMAHTARIPIPDRESDVADESSISEQVYDQLAAAPKSGETPTGEEELPTLGRIESAPVRALSDSAASVGIDLPGRHTGVVSDTGVAGDTGVASDTGVANKTDAASNIAGRISPLAAGAALQRAEHGRATASETLGALDEPRVGGTTAVGMMRDSERDAQRKADRLEATKNEVADTKSRLTTENARVLGRTAVATSGAGSARADKVVELEALSQKILKAPSDIDQESGLEKLPTPKPVASSGLVRDSLNKGWYAQVAAPEKISEAEALAARLKRGGFPALIERANVRGQIYYRVVVGPEKDRVQVDRLIAQVKREGFNPFPRAVK